MQYAAMMAAIRKALQADTPQSSKMAAAITLWARMYEGHAPWNGKQIKSAGIAAAVAAEHAKLVTLEMQTTLTGADALQTLYTGQVAPRLRKYTEYALAKGGLVLKPIVTQGHISMQFIQADGFFPLAFDDSDSMTRCAFCSRIRQNRAVLTLLEIHTLEGEILTVENRAFRSQSSTSLGTEIPLTAVEQWAGLSPRAQFSGAKKLPIGLFRCPIANEIDTASPLGVSVYARAAELIEEADRRYSGICWEYESKETAVHIAENLLRFNKDTDKFEAPSGRERLYRALPYATGASEKPLLEVYSPEIRSQQLLEGWNAQMRMIEFACSLAYGTLSDPNTVDKTAEEIRTAKQRSYTFVTDCQNALAHAIRDFLDGASFWLQIYGMPAGYTVAFDFGDSILTDPQAARQQDLQDVAAGLMNAWEYRMRWYDEDEATAKSRVPAAGEVLL